MSGKKCPFERLNYRAPTYMEIYLMQRDNYQQDVSFSKPTKKKSKPKHSLSFLFISFERAQPDVDANPHSCWAATTDNNERHHH